MAFERLTNSKTFRWMSHPVVMARRENLDYAQNKLLQQANRLERGYIGQQLLRLADSDRRLIRWPASLGVAAIAVTRETKIGWLYGRGAKALALSLVVGIIDLKYGPIAGRHADPLNDIYWGTLLSLAPVRKYLDARRVGRAKILMEELVASGQAANVAETLIDLREGTSELLLSKLSQAQQDTLNKSISDVRRERDWLQKFENIHVTSDGGAVARELVDAIEHDRFSEPEVAALVDKFKQKSPSWAKRLSEMIVEEKENRRRSREEVSFDLGEPTGPAPSGQGLTEADLRIKNEMLATIDAAEKFISNEVDRALKAIAVADDTKPYNNDRILELRGNMKLGRSMIERRLEALRNLLTEFGGYKKMDDRILAGAFRDTFQLRADYTKISTLMDEIRGLIEKYKFEESAKELQELLNFENSLKKKINDERAGIEKLRRQIESDCKAQEIDKDTEERALALLDQAVKRLDVIESEGHLEDADQNYALSLFGKANAFYQQVLTYKNMSNLASLPRIPDGTVTPATPMPLGGQWGGQPGPLPIRIPGPDFNLLEQPVPKPDDAGATRITARPEAPAEGSTKIIGNPEEPAPLPKPTEQEVAAEIAIRNAAAGVGEPPVELPEVREPAGGPLSFEGPVPQEAPPAKPKARPEESQVGGEAHVTQTPIGDRTSMFLGLVQLLSRLKLFEKLRLTPDSDDAAILKALGDPTNLIRNWTDEAFALLNAKKEDEGRELAAQTYQFAKGLAEVLPQYAERLKKLMKELDEAIPGADEDFSGMTNYEFTLPPAEEAAEPSMPAVIKPEMAKGKAPAAPKQDPMAKALGLINTAMEEINGGNIDDAQSTISILKGLLKKVSAEDAKKLKKKIEGLEALLD